MVTRKMVNSQFWAEKKVFVTGHTGFKGSWLVSWLNLIGADVVGVSLPDENHDSLFKSTGMKKSIKDYRLDIRDTEELNKVIQDEKPDFVFHLAAQALVRKSYIDPLLTWSTNVMGTVNVLDSLRKSIIFIASVVISGPISSPGKINIFFLLIIK